jgi:hypothetical protein
MNTLLIINNLPNEIKSNILGFLPLKIYIFLKKEYYIKNHSKIKQFICYSQYENYIRFLIRNDYFFVFELLIKENFKKWIHFTKYIYKNNVFSNYIYFLHYYSVENDSDKCKNIIHNTLSLLSKKSLFVSYSKKNTNRRNIK